MINIVQGDLFKGDYDILINTVNCVGAMGKGIAFKFKKLYPQMYKEYKNKCDARFIEIGKMWIWFDERTKKIIINFPTKYDWRKKSEYSWIDLGLDDLYKELSKIVDKYDKPIRVGIPALGCSNGGLDWTVVKTMIENKLKDVNLHIDLFEPGDPNER